MDRAVGAICQPATREGGSAIPTRGTGERKSRDAKLAAPEAGKGKSNRVVADILLL